MKRHEPNQLAAAALVAALAAAGLTAHAGEQDRSRPAPAEWMLKKLDRDEDGVITREEFRAPALERFDKLDTNGDGMISREEWTAGVDARFDRMDANGDGRLDREIGRASCRERG